MKRYVSFLLLITILITGCLVAAGTSYYAKNTVEKSIVGQMNAIQQLFISRFRAFDQLIANEEEELEKEALKHFPKVVQKLLSLGVPLKDLSREALKDIAQEQGYGELYLINRNGVVFNTTFQPDEGFDLNTISPEFSQWLNGIYGKGQVFNDRLVLSSKTGILNKYIYYSPVGADFIVETSINIRSYLAKVKSVRYRDFLFHDFFLDPVESNSKVYDLDLFMFNDIAQWSVLHEGEGLDQGVVEILRNKPVVIIEKNGLRTIYARYSPIASKGVFSQDFCTKITYDISELDALTKKMLFFSVAIILLIIPVAFFFAFRQVNLRLIRPVQNIRDGLLAIARGNYDTKIKGCELKEFAMIAESADTMRKEILKREEDLKEETKKLLQNERLLIQQSKMAAMGEMIGAISHQWRQPLNSLGLRIQNLGYEYEDGDVTQESINEMIRDSMNEIDYMSHTIDDFRSFFLMSKEKKHFNLVEAIGDAVRLSAPQLRDKKIEVTVVNELPEGASLFGYPNEFKQVLLNLFSNAKDGILHKEPQCLSESGYVGSITITLHVDNDNVFVDVKDSGVGIPEEIVNRVFDPYFTTKEEGKGTGIGLYMSRCIIENNMGGELSVRNTREGAFITIKMPKGEGWIP